MKIFDFFFLADLNWFSFGLKFILMAFSKIIILNQFNLDFLCYVWRKIGTFCFMVEENERNTLIKNAIIRQKFGLLVEFCYFKPMQVDTKCWHCSWKCCQFSIIWFSRNLIHQILDISWMVTAAFHTKKLKLIYSKM